jgi:hypothetical protein
LRGNCGSGLGSGFALLLFETGFCRSDDGRKGFGVMHGEVGEDLAIDFDASGIEAFDEAGVGQVFGPGRSTDALDPETTELSFPLLAVTVFVFLRFADGVLGVAEELRAESAKGVGPEKRGFINGVSPR